jgi:NitT/TauT family transport system ATP-binding protein
VIRVEGVSKTYLSQDGEAVDALLDINLEVAHSEFITLVGPSGCGKSTLLKILVGHLPVSAGAIWFDGARVTGPRIDVGMVFQEPVLLVWRTVIDNVLFPMEILRRRGDHAATAQRLLDLVGSARL